MVIGIIGESCTGKSTLADKLKSLLGAEVYTGKDYLRFAKNEAIAKKLFQKKLEDAVSGAHIVYVISEKEHLPLLPDDAFRVLVTADLDAIKKLLRLNGAAPYSGVMRKAVRENDFDSFIRFCASINEKQDEKGKKTLSELVNYFQNNWDSIVERLNGSHPGSCTEPIISHVLSERLSRNPLAWSREGLGKMAMLRVFTENGGKVTAEHIRVSRSRKERACSRKPDLWQAHRHYHPAQSLCRA